MKDFCAALKKGKKKKEKIRIRLEFGKISIN